MPAPVPVQPLILSYAHGFTVDRFRIPVWLLIGLVPAVISIPLNFTWGRSPLEVFAEFVESPRQLFQFDDLLLLHLALGLSLGLPTLILSLLVGRALRTAHITALCILPFAAMSMLSAACIVLLMTYGLLTDNGPHQSFAWVWHVCYSAVFLTGLGFLIRNIRRCYPLAQITLLALTTAYLAISLFCLIGFYDHRNPGYYVTVGGYPFYLLLAIRLIQHTPANQ